MDSLIVVGARAARAALRRRRQVPPHARFDLRVWNIGPLSLVIASVNNQLSAPRRTKKHSEKQRLNFHMFLRRD